MPIKIHEDLPAYKILNDENIFVMNEDRAYHQDIRPLEIAILNLMPTKIVTEIQLLRLIGNTPLQINVSLLHPKTHTSVNTPIEHLSAFYKTFDEVKQKKFDRLIITGAPVEQMEFEDVNYWDELKEIMEWSQNNVYSTLYICWAAQAGLKYFYNIEKHKTQKKIFGVFSHQVLKKNIKLFRGFDDVFFAPHSRHTEIMREDIINNKELELLAESNEAGVYIAIAKSGRQVFVTGHSEYDQMTLKAEYDRDINKGMNIDVPKNYFPYDDPKNEPVVTWRSHANLLFFNWLNYYVYQETPYDIETWGRF